MNLLVIYFFTALAAGHVADPPNLGSRQVTKDGRCGTGFGTVCEKDECCSSAGYCPFVNVISMICG